VHLHLSLTRLPPTPPLFPYTTLFRSSRGAHKRIVPGDSRGRFAHPTGGFKPGYDIPLLRGINDGDRLRCEGPGFRWPAVLLLLRSEEHTSELQSRFDLVCRRLLEKKK